MLRNQYEHDKDTQGTCEEIVAENVTRHLRNPKRIVPKEYDGPEWHIAGKQRQSNHIPPHIVPTRGEQSPNEFERQWRQSSGNTTGGVGETTETHDSQKDAEKLTTMMTTKTKWPKDNRNEEDLELGQQWHADRLKVCSYISILFRNSVSNKGKPTRFERRKHAKRVTFTDLIGHGLGEGPLRR